MINDIMNFLQLTGFVHLTWQMIVMWGVVLTLLYLAIYKGFEPLLLVPIAFGALMANLPTRGVLTLEHQPNNVIDSGFFKVQGHLEEKIENPAPGANMEISVKRVEGGLFDFICQGIKLEIFPPLIFLGVGALTDFGPLIANPRTLLLGAAAQFGVFVTFLGATFLGFSSGQAASIGIIGGADGPTAIFTTNKLAPELLGPIAVAAYSYMALVPLIQPPIMRLLTTKKERLIRMKSLRQVSKHEKIAFCLVTAVATTLLVPDASALLAMLMLGNLLRECGVTERLLKASQNEIINIVTIFLGTSVGITMQGERFLQPQTLKIIVLGVVAFGFSTVGGLLLAKIMNWMYPKNPINPLIGSAGVSAVPMAARVSQVEGQKADPGNYLLMHAMGPNVAGVIGTAVVAGYFISTLKG
ncbi:MAG: sodium ion-translocating decarboxylase subunit beta [Verrucomicrobiota bacterium]